MIKTKKATGRVMSLPAGIAVGGMVSLTVTVVLAGILAWFMGREIIAEDTIGIASAIILVISALAGGLAAFSKIRHRRVLVCMLSGVVYFLLLLCCTALFFGGQYQGMVITALTVLGGGGAAALLGLKGGEKRPRKYVRKGRSR